jgi:hypothetical protein
MAWCGEAERREAWQEWRGEVGQRKARQEWRVLARSGEERKARQAT